MRVQTELLSDATFVRADFRRTLALAEGRADLILTSPPYCDMKTYDSDVRWGMDEYRALGDALFTALRPGGTALVVLDAPVRSWRRTCLSCGRSARVRACPTCGATTVGSRSERGVHVFAALLDWTERVGLLCPDVVAFVRDGIPGKFPGRFRNCREHALWLERGGGRPTFHKLTEPCAWPGAHAHGKGGGGGTMGKDRRRRGRESYVGIETDERYVSNVWRFHVGSRASTSRGHVATFPEALAERAIACFTDPGDLVVDPFLGSGTSAVASARLGRRFLGGDPLCRGDGVPWVDVARDAVSRVETRDSTSLGSAVDSRRAGTASSSPASGRRRA